MRNPTFKAIEPNYRKNVLEVTLQEGRKLARYNLPFAVFKGKRIGPRNRFVLIDSARPGPRTGRGADARRGDRRHGFRLQASGSGPDKIAA